MVMRYSSNRVATEETCLLPTVHNILHLLTLDRGEESKAFDQVAIIFSATGVIIGGLHHSLVELSIVF